MVKKGLRLEPSLCRASRVTCDPSTKRMWSQKHFWKTPLTEPAPGFDLGVCPAPASPKEPGCLPCPDGPVPWNHSWQVGNTLWGHEGQAPSWQQHRVHHWPSSPVPQPGALEHFRDGDSPLPWAASANPGTIHRKSSSHLNLQWANIRCFPRSSLKKFHTHFWVTV